MVSDKESADIMGTHLNSPSWGARVLCVLVSIIALGLVLSRIDLRALAKSFIAVHATWLALALGLLAIVFLLLTWRWHLLLSLGGNALHVGTTFRIVLIGHCFNLFFFGAAGGDVAKSALYTHWYRDHFSTIWAKTVLDRLIGLAGFASFLAIAVWFGWQADAFSEFGPLRWNAPTQTIIGGAILGIAILVTLMICRRRRPESLLASMVSAIFTGMRELARAPGIALAGIGISILGHATMAGVTACCLQAVSPSPLSIHQIWWTFPIISILSGLPISAAGTGVREGSSFLLLTLYDVDGETAVASSLLTLGLFLIWAGIGGWIWWQETRRRAKCAFNPDPQGISVVIPTLNEASALPETLETIGQSPEMREVIVADGGSIDGTLKIAAQRGCRVLSSPRSRGGQLREGANAAQNDVILLLHADTWLPANAGRVILDCLRDPTVSGGGFWKRFRDGSWLMAGSRIRCAIRLYLGGRLLGDQGIFIRREALEAVGGVPDMALMEDFELSRRLRTVGRLALANATVTTSARRFSRLGIPRAYWRMWRITWQYRLGAPIDELVRLYNRDKE